MAEAHIMLRQATGFREMDIYERLSNAFRVLPAVKVKQSRYRPGVAQRVPGS
jgi:hypothetical protein